MRIGSSAFRWMTWLFLAAIFAAPLLGADDVKELKVSARLVPGASSDKAQLKVTAKLDAGWHIYSTTQADGGPIRTAITLKPSQHFQSSGIFKPDRDPEVKFEPDLYPGLAIEEFEKEVTWTADLQLSPGVKFAELAVAGNLNGQICERSCVQVDKDFVAVGESGGAAHPLASAASKSELKGKETHVSVTGRLKIRGEIFPAAVAPGGKAELRITATPAKDYHTYPLADRAPDSGSRSTLIVVTDPAGFHFARPTTTAKIETKISDKPGEAPSQYHEGEVTWVLAIDVPAEAKPGEYVIAGLMGGQVCQSNSCDPPEGTRFSGKLTIGAPQEGSSPLLFVKAKYEDADEAAAQIASAPSRGSDSPAKPAGAAESSTKSDAAAPSTNPLNAEGSLWLFIPLALAGGFILNFMPCVLPVIGLKLLSFAKQAGQDRAQAFVLNLAYALGQLAIFLLLATAAVFLGLGWGEQFTNVAFVVGLTGFMFALSLSLLGVWEMPVPGLGSDETMNEMADGEGLRGAFFQGILTTILSTPCSGPLMGYVFSFCLNQPPYVTYLLFSVMALGMALPYLIIGLEPSLIRFLPKPGEWMDTLKSLVGFSMLAGVAVMVTFTDKDYVLATLLVMVVVAIACWMIGKIPVGSSFGESWPTWTWAGGIIAVSATLAFWFLGPSEHKIEWREYSQPLATKLQKEGHTVMVDFTANWCLICRSNKRYVIETQEVAQLIKQNRVVPVLADWTVKSSAIKEHLTKLKANGIPLLAIYPADKPGEVIVLEGALTQASLLEKLNEAGPSTSRAAPAIDEEKAVVLGGSAK